MKKLIIGLTLLSTVNAFATDFLHPSYRLKKNQFIGNSNTSVTNQIQVRRDSLNNTSLNSSNSQQVFSQNLQYGLSKSATAIVNFSYGLNETQSTRSGDVNSNGVRYVDIGGSYRLNSHVKLPFYLDVTGLVKFAPQDKLLATADDAGTAGSGANKLELTARLSKNRYFIDLGMLYQLEATQYNASTQLEQSNTDTVLDLSVNAGKQFIPMKRMRLNASGVLIRRGEQVTNLQGGTITQESHFQYGLNLLGNYRITQNLTTSLGAEYLLATDHNIESFRDQSVENQTDSRLQLGMTYIF